MNKGRILVVGCSSHYSLLYVTFTNRRLNEGRRRERKNGRKKKFPTSSSSSSSAELSAISYRKRRERKERKEGEEGKEGGKELEIRVRTSLYEFP